MSAFSAVPLTTIYLTALSFISNSPSPVISISGTTGAGLSSSPGLSDGPVNLGINPLPTVAETT